MRRCLVAPLNWVVAGVTLLSGLLWARAQTPFPDGAFVQGQDGSEWVVGNGVKRAIIWQDDTDGSLDAMIEDTPMSNVMDYAPPPPSPAPPAPPSPSAPTSPSPSPAPTRTPAPAAPPAGPGDARAGQTAGNLCSIISTTHFTATVAGVETSSAGGTLMLRVIVEVRNDGAKLDGPAFVAALVDGRGRRFAERSVLDSPRTSTTRATWGRAPM